MKYYLIIDIGGTKTTSAVFNDQGEPITEFKVKKSRTYEGEDAVFQNTVELAYEVLKEAGKTKKDLAGVGVAAPGPLDYRTDLGALAEANVGVAKGENVVLYQTISTGCGGGIAINGEIYHGRSGFAGEFGHMTINFAGPSCGCGGSGCFELYASGTAVNRRMKRDIRCGIKSKAFEGIEYDPEKVNGKFLTEAAAEGDAYAIDMLRQEGYYIGVGLSNLINLLDPDVIVLAGGMAKAYPYFRYSMLDEIRRHACFPFEEDRIRVSELNDKVVAYGAYVMVKKAIDGSL